MASGDLDFARYRDLLANQRWKELTRRLVLYAHDCGRTMRKGWSLAHAEDAVQDVLCRQFDPKNKYRWNPATEPDLFTFLCGPVRWRARRTWTQGFRYVSHTEPELEEIGASRPSHEEGVARVDLARRRTEALKRKFLDDSNALLIIACLEEGLDDVAETAQRIGLDWNQVYNARRRIEAKLAEVKREVPDGEEADQDEADERKEAPRG